jgi:Tfp pilus assembly protein PilE
MITVAIVGILGAIAYPAYTSQIAKGTACRVPKRPDAGHAAAGTLLHAVQRVRSLHGILSIGRHPEIFR